MDKREPELFETIRDAKQRAFLEVYSRCGIVRAAIRATGISSSSPYYWRKHNPAFSAAMDVAQSMASNRLLDESIRRAVEGVKIAKFKSDGEPFIDPRTGEPYFERVYSDRLAIFLLKRFVFTNQGEPSCATDSPSSSPEASKVDWYGS